MYQEDPHYSTNYTNSQQYDSGSQQNKKPSNGMAIAALILGIFSLITCCCGIGGMVFGAAGIIIAVLSRGTEPMETTAKVGLGLSITGLILGFALLIFLFVGTYETNIRSDFDVPYQNGNDFLDDYLDDLPDAFPKGDLEDLIEDYSIQDLSF